MDPEQPGAQKLGQKKVKAQQLLLCFLKENGSSEVSPSSHCSPTICPKQSIPGAPPFLSAGGSDPPSSPGPVSFLQA